MLKYSELSDLYLEAIIETIREICKDENNKIILEENFNTYVCEYLSKISSKTYESWLVSFDYDDYDSFCEWKKDSKMLINKLNSVIEISKIADIIVNVVEIYEENMNSINYLLKQKHNSTAVLIYEHLEHIETLLNKTNLPGVLGGDIQKLHLLCIEVRDEELSKKLKFKIEDLMEGRFS